MTFDQIIVFLAIPLAGYLLGSIPFAWVIGRAHGVDIRTVGSKNIGATNLGRTLGKKYFWQAFLLDAAKGFLPILFATLYATHVNNLFYTPYMALYGPPPPDASSFQRLAQLLSLPNLPPPLLPHWAPLITGIACVLGHLFPVWLKFKGGKGVAVGFGVVLGFWPLYTLAGILAGIFFLLMLLIYRYISLASMTAAVVFAALVAVLCTAKIPYSGTYISGWSDRLPLIIVAGLFAAMILIRHRANITRLMKGTEPKIGQRKVDQGIPK